MLYFGFLFISIYLASEKKHKLNKTLKIQFSIHVFLCIESLIHFKQ